MYYLQLEKLGQVSLFFECNFNTFRFRVCTPSATLKQ